MPLGMNLPDLPGLEEVLHLPQSSTLWRPGLQSGLRMDTLATEVLLGLMAVAALAGFVDAIAGGGGLLALPALLWAGVPPIQALATNKLQGSLGTLTAAWRFVHSGTITLRSLRLAIVLTFAGSLCGTWTVQWLGSERLGQVVPLLLMGFALYFLFSPRVGDEDATQRISHPAFAFCAGFPIGFYDGFFGPGTGSFFALAFVLLLGYSLRRATAGTKVLNFTSNLAALLAFAAADQVIWTIGIPMGIAQMLGAWLGSTYVLKQGSRIIRPMLVIVSLAISLRLLFPPA